MTDPLPRRILVTGASVAGNTIAWWLAKHGCRVTVVERNAGFRNGGQNVDVKGIATEVLDLMGLRAAVAASGTGETGVAFVDEDDRIVAQFGIGFGLTAELEILRDDLARLIYEPASTMAEYRFGDALSAVEQDEDGAHVTFAGGRRDTFDAVIVAEGVGSATRDLVFPGENTPRWLDMTVGYFTIPKGATDSSCARWYNAKGGVSILLRPDRQGCSRAFLMVQAPPDRRERRSVAEQKAFFRERFASAGWETQRVLDGMERSGDFYFDVLRQVRLDRWSAGRVVLTGDAAWCPTPLSGMGSSLAIVGAYVLAGEMAKAGTLADAFAGYERTMRPIVAASPPVPKLVARLMHPRTDLGVALQRGVIRLTASPLVRKIVAALPRGKASEPALPVYAGAVQAAGG